MDTLDDAALALRIRGRDPGAESELYRRFARRVWLCGRRRMRDDAAADDLVQDVLAAVLESLRAGRVAVTKVGPYVLATARQMAWQHNRTTARRARILDAAHDPPQEVRAPLIDIEALRGCIEALQPRERAIIVSTFYAEHDSEQIAAELGMTTGNVRVVRHRAVTSLQRCMGIDA